MPFHYSIVKDCLDVKPENQKILIGLNNWIKHITLGNITTKLFVFKKLKFIFYMKSILFIFLSQKISYYLCSINGFFIPF